MVGRLPVFASVALFVVGSLAGCLGDGKGGGGLAKEGEDDETGGGDPVFTQTTGAISGYVLDVLFAPIPGATVSLTKDGAAVENVTADDTGAYAISEIPPGAYLVFANKTGFRPKSKPITVTEGTLLRENFLLEEAPSVTPFVEPTIEFNGYLECSVAPPNGRCAQTLPQAQQGNHRPGQAYAVKDGLQAMLFEMVWAGGSNRGIGLNDGGTGGSGGGMTLALSWSSSDSGLGAASANGVNGEIITIYLERRICQTEAECGSADQVGQWRIFCMQGCEGDMGDWPFQAGGVVSYSGNPNAPNLVLQRHFEIYVTAFYYTMKPDGFTGIPEA